MSSTLFGRGVNTQVGMRQRAEAVQRSLEELRGASSDVVFLRTEVQTVVRENNTFKTLVGVMERRITTLETELAIIKSQIAAQALVAAAATAHITE